MIPTSASGYLAAKRATLQHRRARLTEKLAAIDSELEQIADAERVINAPRNGRAVKRPEILKDLPTTQKDRVLEAVRSRPKSGITRQWIAEKLDRQGTVVGLTAISVYLTRLQRDGLVCYDKGLWFPTSS